MTKERFYDVMVTLLSAAIITGITWIVGIEKKLPQVDKNTINIERVNTRVDDVQRRQNENFIKILEAINEVKIELKDKENRK